METKHSRILFFVTLMFLMFAHGQTKGLIRGKGCFKDSIGDRVLPVLLFARDQNNKINWDDLSGSVINKCKQMAIKKNYKCFGIQFYGECWTGNEGACQSFNRLGQSSKCFCSSDKFSPFVAGSRCLGAVGGEFTNYVYEILD